MLKHIESSLSRGYLKGTGNILTSRLLALWNEKAREILPPELFSAQVPKSFKNGVLALEVENATVGAEINLKAQQIIKGVNQKLKKEVLKRVVFRVV